jgi:hypothetical protein
MRFAVLRAVRPAAIGFAALVAAALGPVTTALAFDKVDHLQAVQAGRGYVYFLRELDAHKQPVAGRTVTVKVGTVPGGDASVAPSDAKGHATGPAGATASAISGADGLVYFVLHTSTKPGDDEFIWNDVSWTGEVLITGLAPTAALPAAAPAAKSVAKPPAHNAAAAAPSPSHGLPPWAAGLIASALVWAGLPLAGQRWRTKYRLVPLAALPDV